MEENAQSASSSKGSVGKSLPRPPELSVDDATVWLTSRASGNKCPMCGWTVWNILSDDDNVLTIQYVRADKPLMTAMMLIECDRCAFTASFMVSSIQAWIKNGKPEFKGGDDE